MLVGIKDLMHAKARFLLITLVALLLTVLVGFLTGLGKGLDREGNQAIADTDAQSIVLQKPSGNSELSFTDSQLNQADINAYQKDKATPVGLSMGKVVKGKNTDNVVLWGQSNVSAGKVKISKSTAELLNAKVGDTVNIFSQDFEVSKIVDDKSFSFVTVLDMNLNDWQKIAAQLTGSQDVKASFLMADSKDISAANSQTVVESKKNSYAAISGYAPQQNSFKMINAMLYGITALVVGAFFAVWTQQRKQDIAVLKALGASKGTLLKDALGQATIVLAIGVLAGTLLNVIFGLLIQKVMPFELNFMTIGLPAVIIMITGLIGAGLAVKSITKVDPLIALGSAR
ncbi:MAG: ABC transporter permease [Micrococcaceae bacterium]